MNIDETIEILEAEKRNLEKQIETLKVFRDQNQPKKRGGRIMSAAERRTVSVRLKKAWAERRKNDAQLTPEQIRERISDFKNVN